MSRRGPSSRPFALLTFPGPPPAPAPHPVVAKVARLALISEMGTEFIDKVVSAMLDKLDDVD